MAAAPQLGVRDTFHEDPATFTDGRASATSPSSRKLAAEGKFTVPAAGTFALDRWRTALEISLSGHARGKLLLLPGLRPSRLRTRGLGRAALSCATAGPSCSRNLAQLRHAGEIVGALVFPVIMVVIFGYIFGSAIAVPEAATTATS